MAEDNFDNINNEEQKLIASCIPGAVYHEITSKFGHDGFLLENDQLTEIIKPLLP